MNDFLKQLGRLWGQLGIGQRLTIIVAVVGVVAGMVGVVYWSSRPQMQLLYGKLGDKDVAEVVASIQEQGVKYEIGAGGSSIYVASDRVHLLRAQLAAKGVPSGGGVGFEIFDRSNFGISDFVQRTNYIRAVQGELSRTIAQIRGVRSARVMIVMPENRLLFTDSKAKPTASVFIEQNTGALNQEAVNSIRFLVANAVEGLGVNEVAVVDSHGAVLTENLKDDPSLGAASSQMKYRKGVEDYFSQKVESMLAKVLGPGNAVVRVSAEVDSESSTTVEERFDPDGQVIRNETTTEVTNVTNETDGSSSSKKSAVGMSANVPSTSDGENSGKQSGKNSEESTRNKTNSYEINRTTVNSVKNPGGISHISAAVFVAAKAKPRTPQEMDSLRKMVVNALGIKGNNAQEMERSVSIQEVAFEAQAVAAAKPDTLTDTIMNNQDLLRNLFGMTLAAAVIFGFLHMLKRSKPYEIPIEVLQPSAGELLVSSGPSGERGLMSNGDASNKNVSVEMLNEMVRKKPENVGAALRGWMSTPNK